MNILIQLCSKIKEVQSEALRDSGVLFVEQSLGLSPPSPESPEPLLLCIWNNFSLEIIAREPAAVYISKNFNLFYSYFGCTLNIRRDCTYDSKSLWLK